MKKLMILGGSRYILPLIKVTHDLGCYVITCDYLPDNIAHKYSDEYCNVSIIEKDKVLEKAQELHIDGIMSFACDPGVVTAAYVAEKMGLPSQGPYESVCILQNKGRFRKFLKDNGFNVPNANSYTDADTAISDLDKYNWPVIVKPTDSAGSKGVTRVDERKNILEAISYAQSFSKNNEFIIEDFLEKKGFSSDTDSFSVDGEMKFISFNSQFFDEKSTNPYAPAAFGWPSAMSLENQQYLADEIKRLIKLLDMKTSVYNIETRECTDGKAYIMECSPRGGGNRLSECLDYATKSSMIENSVRAALGMELIDNFNNNYQGYWAEIIIHSNENGVFDDLWISDEVKAYLVEKDLWVEKGQKIEAFSAANFAIGTLVFNFARENEYNNFIKNINKNYKVIIK